MKHFYRFVHPRGVDVVIADDTIQALGCWEANQPPGKPEQGKSEDDTAQCIAVPDDHQIEEMTAGEWAGLFTKPLFIGNADVGEISPRLAAAFDAEVEA